MRTPNCPSPQAPFLSFPCSQQALDEKPHRCVHLRSVQLGWAVRNTGVQRVKVENGGNG